MPDRAPRNDRIVRLPQECAPVAKAIIEAFPDHARIIGFLVAEWSHLEYQLMLFLATSMKLHSSIISPMLYAIESSGARLEAMRAAFKAIHVGDAKALEDAMRIIDEAQSLLTQRNKFAHSLYGISGTGEMAILGMRKETAGDLPLHDLSHQFERMKALSHKIGFLIANELGLVRQEATPASTAPEAE